MKSARSRCPLCDSTQFSVQFDAEGRATKVRCFYCREHPRVLLAALQGRALDELRQSATEIVPRDEGRNWAAALRTWNHSQSIEGTLAARYLHQRGITVRIPGLGSSRTENRLKGLSGRVTRKK